MIDEILKLTKINQLKQTYRMSSVGDRKESAAEHTWSALMLADYFFDKIEQQLDRLKVFELLLYHDVVELEANDTPLHPEVDPGNKEEREREAAKVLKEVLPMGNRFFTLFHEYEAKESLEAQYAVAIDKLDSIIQELDYKEDWKGWSRTFLLEKKEHFFMPFPQLHKIFLELIDYLEQEGYFSQ